MNLETLEVTAPGGRRFDFQVPEDAAPDVAARARRDRQHTGPAGRAGLFPAQRPRAEALGVLLITVPQTVRGRRQTSTAKAPTATSSAAAKAGCSASRNSSAVSLSSHRDNQGSALSVGSIACRFRLPRVSGSSASLACSHHQRAISRSASAGHCCWAAGPTRPAPASAGTPQPLSQDDATIASMTNGDSHSRHITSPTTSRSNAGNTKRSRRREISPSAPAPSTLTTTSAAPLGGHETDHQHQQRHQHQVGKTVADRLCRWPVGSDNQNSMLRSCRSRRARPGAWNIEVTARQKQRHQVDQRRPAVEGEALMLSLSSWIGPNGSATRAMTAGANARISQPR